MEETERKIARTKAVVFDKNDADILLIHGYCGWISTDVIALIEMFTPGTGELHLITTAPKSDNHYSISLPSLLQSMYTKVN